MGNQIKFTPREKENSFTDEATLEMENIQLKATNRKLISKLDQQKQLIKKLNGELESLRRNKEFADFNQLKRDYQTLKGKNENLETLLIQSKKEISHLKNELKKLTKESDETKNSPWARLKNMRK